MSTADAIRRLSVVGTETGLSEVAGKLDKLSTAQKGVTETSRTQERQTLSMERRLNTIQRQYDATYRSTEAMARVERDLTGAEAQGLVTLERKAELLRLAQERLMGSADAQEQAWRNVMGIVDPVLAAQLRAEQQLTAARQAAKDAVERGLATEVQAASVIEKLRLQQVADLQRVKDAQDRVTTSAATGGASRFNSSNVAAQFQDIGVTAAMGMNPLMIALQQGTQLSAVFNDARQSGQSMAGTLLSAFTSILNPISLVTIGVVALGAAAIQWLGSLTQAAPEAEDALEAHLEWVRKVAQGYGEAQAAAAAVVEETRRLPQGSVELDLQSRIAADTRARQAAVEALTQANLKLRLSELDLYATASSSNDAANRQAEALLDLQASIDPLNPGLGDLHTRLKEIEQTAADDVIRDTAAEFRGLVEDAMAAELQVNSTTAALTELARVGANMTIGITLDSTATGLDRIRALAPDLRDQYQQVADELDRVKKQATADLPDALARPIILAAEDEAKRTVAALDEAARQREAIKAAASGTKAGEKAGRDYDDLLASTRERIAAAETEARALGLSSEAAARLRYEQELLNDAANDNFKLLPDQVEQLYAQAGAMAAAEERTRQLTEAYTLGKSVFTGFFSDFRSELMNGTALWASFAQAGVNALDTLAQKALESATSGLWDMLFGAVAGGLTGGATGGSWGNGLWGSAIFKSAMGNVMSGPGISAYSNSIVDRPTLFPFAKGVGLMGEAGDEAIMPLQRMPDGRLGVSAQGGGAANENRGSGRIAVEVEVYVRDDGKLAAIARTSGENAARVTVRDEVPDMIDARAPLAVSRAQRNRTASS